MEASMLQLICWLTLLSLLAIAEFGPVAVETKLALLASLMMVGPILLLLPAIVRRLRD